MENTQLQKWSDLLLDISKKNNLINFKNSTSISLKVISPNFDEIFDNLINLKKYQIANKSDGEFGNRSNNSLDTIIVNNLKYKTKDVLNNLIKKTKSYYDETGLNICYITFGSFVWNDSERGQTYRAPIVLLPIKLERNTYVDPVSLSLLEDEFYVNPNFAFKLEKEFLLHIPEFSGQGIVEYLDSIDNIIKPINWSVEQDCNIGAFSFMKLDMYYDLHNNENKILQNNNIRLLLGESEINKIPNVNTNYDFKSLHPVIDADSSQLNAINLARQGQSFVLQGPPGTGKSQTITNIIAECLYDGKKVLFVSEKMAALNVVYNKLKQVGLSDYCLELHSNKSNKKEVIAELYKTLFMDKVELSNKVKLESAFQEDTQSILDDYCIELHKKQDIINLSIYEIVNEIFANKCNEHFNYNIKNISEYNQTRINVVCSLLTKYVNYTKYVGYDYRNSKWYGFQNIKNSSDLKKEFLENLQQFYEYLTEINDQIFKLNSTFNLDIQNIATYKKYLRFIKTLNNNINVNANAFNTEDVRIIIHQLMKIVNCLNAMNELKKKIDNYFNDSFYQLDSEKLLNKMNGDYSKKIKRVFSSDYYKVKKEIKTKSINKFKCSYINMHEYIECLNNYNKLEGLLSRSISYLEKYYNLIVKPTDDVEKLIVEYNFVESFILDNEISEILDIVKNDSIKFKELNSSYITADDEILKTYSDSINYINNTLNRMLYDVDYREIIYNIDKIRNCITHYNEFESWISFLSLLKELQDNQVLDIIINLLDNKVDISNFIRAFLFRVYTLWAESLINKNDVLHTLTRIDHDRVLELFKNKDLLQFEINKAAINSVLSKRRPNLKMVSAGSAVSILMHEGEKKRRQMSVRKLLYSLGNLVQELKPCFLMSPLSVSTYLGQVNMDFDVVIFDEASQIFPQDAIGSIYRGKQLIVVGDSKQMPPSNYFNANFDMEDEETGDYESILDLCSTVLPQIRLQWHYRSQYEQLITFSNLNFYDHSLVTFPSNKFNSLGIGVDYYHVDGIFNHNTRTNTEEANFVVDLIFENITKYPERSLGVVAFSLSQQNLIEQILEKRKKECAQLKEFNSKHLNEPLFIKNLESVQGDERDTIIFSVAYAKDANGKLLHYFGPLSVNGGERRLNVAITRAKINVKLVSSIYSEDIDLKRTNSVGVRLLKEYLAYANNGVIKVNKEESECSSNGIITDIQNFLLSKDIKSTINYGSSRNKIELAVKKEDKDEYCMAIECDGDQYNKNLNTRDRDRLRQNVIERMGWTYYRIWTTDWFNNNYNEKKALLDKYNAIVNDLDSEEWSINKNKTSDDFEVDVSDFQFKVYSMSDDVALFNRYLKGIPVTGPNKGFINFIKAILEKEAPINEKWLLRRISFVFGSNKINDEVKRLYVENMKGHESKGISYIDGFLFLNDNLNVAFRRSDNIPLRQIDEISTYELAAGILSVLKYNKESTKEGIFRMLSKELGFNRFTSTINNRFNESLECIKDKIYFEGDNIGIKDGVIEEN